MAKQELKTHKEYMLHKIAQNPTMGDRVKEYTDNRKRGSGNDQNVERIVDQLNKKDTKPNSHPDPKVPHSK